MEWEQTWNALLNKYKLRAKVEEMNLVDEIKGNSTNTKEICHYIYDDYKIWQAECKRIEADIWKIIEEFHGVHLHTSRIKTVESLLVKVITKRHEWLADNDNKYAKLNGKNYKDIITDIIGLRLIINYRGKWMDIHNEILSAFPMDQRRIYEADQLLTHLTQLNIQAELPKVYYAEGDEIEQYVVYGLVPKQHKMNYRSIHYTVSFQGAYVELQIRTIYDEAWSDCDHNYVYKKDENKSHSALEQMSLILSKLTNLSNDIGDLMKDIYDSQSIVDDYNGGWMTSDAVIAELNKAVQRMEVIEEDLKKFNNKLAVDKKYNL